MEERMRLSVALRVVMRAIKKEPGKLGELLYKADKTGHCRLCRLLGAVRHHGPHGTFVQADHQRLEAGGALCIYGVQCGDPTSKYMDHMNELHEHFRRTARILKASGALITMAWGNSKFSAEGLCKCGKSEEHKLPLHDPLCPYRVEHGIEVTIEEYKAALGRLQ